MALSNPLVSPSPQIEISIYDKDLIGSDLIGSYHLDTSYLYYQTSPTGKPHTLYREWLVLTAPFEARQGGLFMDDSKVGSAFTICLALPCLALPCLALPCLASTTAPNLLSHLLQDASSTHLHTTQALVACPPRLSASRMVVSRGRLSWVCRRARKAT